MKGEKKDKQNEHPEENPSRPEHQQEGSSGHQMGPSMGQPEQHK